MCDTQRMPEFDGTFLRRVFDQPPPSETRKPKAKPWLMLGYLRQLLRNFVAFCRYGELIGTILLSILYHIIMGFVNSLRGKKPPVRLTQVGFVSRGHCHSYACVILRL